MWTLRASLAGVVPFMNTPFLPPLPAVLVALAVCWSPAPAGAQQRADVPGSVVDVATGQGIRDVVLRVEGTDASAATDAEGRFVLRGIPEGQWTLRVDHLAYGSHRHEISVDAGQLVELQIRLAAEAIELEPIVVETQTARQRTERAQGSSLNVVERPQIERALGTSRHMGDLIRQTVPGIRLRQSNNLAGTDVCLEFRGAATISLVKRSACAHPMVLLDGVPVSDPNYLYGTVGLSNIERIQVIPPGEAGARYGTGSLYGVILIETRPPGRSGDAGNRPVVPLGLQRERMTFDWSQEPAGHPLARAILGATVGNTLGLLAGLAVGRHCIGVDDKNQIVTSCGGATDALAILGAIALPALGGAVGVRLGGATEGSVGKLLPAMVGAGMMLFPGYAFSMSTVGGGSAAANAIGNTLLVVGPPLVLSVADRLFRNTR
jgi:hypothetical protein